ncbi:hypothetical protein [Streptomyces sp. NPDC001056]
MKDTIAVALITAASTLGGGLTTGGFAMWVNRRQLQTQKFNTEMERLEQRRTHHRDTRKESYLIFLQRVESFQDALRAAWRAQPPSNTDEDNPSLEALLPAMDRLSEALNVVALEGSEEVAGAGSAVWQQMQSEGIQLHRLHAEHRGVERMMSGISTPQYNAAEAQRRESIDTFIRIARGVLGGDVPGFHG